MVARSLVLRFLLLGMVAVALPGPAWAQDPMFGNTQIVSQDEEDLPVMSRPRPEFDLKGIKLGGFRLFPSLTVNGTYDTNIDRVSTAVEDDFIVSAAPSLRLQSQWETDLLEAFAGANSYNYLTHSEESLTDWNAGVDGRYEIERGATVYAVAQASELHEQRSSPNTLGNQAEANRYYQYHAEVDGSYQPNRLGLTTGLLVDRYHYENTPLVGGGTLDNSDRNYDEYQAYAKAFYDFSPGYSGFVRGSWDARPYEQFLDRSLLHRSSYGYRVDAGADLQLTHLISGEGYIGYIHQSFTAPLRDIDGLDFNAKIDWLATPLLTVHLVGSKSLDQTVLSNVSASDDKSVQLSADYEFMRNIIVQAHATYVWSSFPGIVREDNSPDLGLGVLYLIDSHLNANLTYDYNARSTTLTGFGYHDSLISLSVTVHD